jgi:hypothetical protein
MLRIFDVIQLYKVSTKMTNYMVWQFNDGLALEVVRHY